MIDDKLCYILTKPPVRRPLQKRVYWAEDCKYCADYKKGDFFPPHDASDNCESGRRNHCTCDTCF